MTVGSLALVVRPFDISVAPFDAFVTRRLEVVRLLRKHYRIAIILLRQPSDTSCVHPDLAGDVVAELSTPRLDMSRNARLTRALRGLAVAETPDELMHEVRRTGAGRAVTFGPWLDQQFQPVFASVPTLHMFEEDLSRMQENAPQSLQARVLRTVEARLSARTVPQPRVVVHIGVGEERSARSRYPRSGHLWFPYLLPTPEWHVTEAPPGSEGVLVVGNMSEARNAEGLAEVLSAAGPQGLPPISVISAAGVHEVLRPHLEEGSLCLLQNVASPYDAYRRARVTLIPARRVTGIKTTLMQAWAAGCPVVCFPSSASSVGPWAADAVQVGHTAMEIVQRLQDLLTDAETATDLAARGRVVLSKHFDAHRREQALLAVVAGLTR